MELPAVMETHVQILTLVPAVLVRAVLMFAARQPQLHRQLFVLLIQLKP
jgi:hypothetical protein